MCACQSSLKQISIHALLAESDRTLRTHKLSTVISIHALLAESDNNESAQVVTRYISIHALLAESDLCIC